MAEGIGRGWWAPPKGTHTGKLSLNRRGKSLRNRVLKNTTSSSFRNLSKEQINNLSDDKLDLLLDIDPEFALQNALERMTDQQFKDLAKGNPHTAFEFANSIERKVTAFNFDRVQVLYKFGDEMKGNSELFNRLTLEAPDLMLSHFHRPLSKELVNSLIHKYPKLVYEHATKYFSDKDVDDIVSRLPGFIKDTAVEIEAIRKPFKEMCSKAFGEIGKAPSIFLPKEDGDTINPFNLKFASSTADVSISFYKEKKTIDWLGFYVNDEKQGKGIARRFLQEFIPFLQKHGYRRLEFAAGSTVGGYAWARYGGKPKANDFVMKRFKESLILKTKENADKWGSGDLTKEIEKINKIKTLYEIATYRGDWVNGKDVLLNTGWDGYIDL